MLPTNEERMKKYLLTWYLLKYLLTNVVQQVLCPPEQFAFSGLSRVSGSPSPVGVVEVICVAHNVEGVVEVVLNDTPSSSIR